MASRLTVLTIAFPFAAVGPDAAGGSEQVAAALDRALVAAGHASIVIACEGSSILGEQVAMPWREDEPIDDDARARVHQAVRAAAARLLRQRPIDLVHLHGIDFPDYLPTPGPPALVTLHLPPGWYSPDALRRTRPNTWFNAVSRSQDRALRHVVDSEAILAPVTNGVPVETLGAACHARRNFALMLGRICPEKGQHLGLQAAYAAGITALVAGRVYPYPEHEAYFWNQLAPRLRRRRCYLGPVGFARKRRLLSAARCLLVPSLAPETSSLVAMEALACGTPVIAFASGALPEIIEPGVTGFLVRDATEMAQAIRRAHRIDPEACRRAARARFSLGRMTDAYLALYERLATARIARCA